MRQVSNTDAAELDNIIVGRVEPHIYAFSTETIPNYLKVGDTYRPLQVRLEEWRKHFPNLHEQFADLAKADDETYFRDYAVHEFLEGNKRKKRLEKESLIGRNVYYSNEFFENTDVKDVEEAIIDIKHSYAMNEGKYQFYKFEESRLPTSYKYRREEEYEPRPNQQEAIDNFCKAVSNGRKNLLMYAVMRFGKSFTSMCCATAMEAKVVVVVSAKADVKEEWKRTVESHIRFQDYEFLDSKKLLESATVISDTIAGGKKVVLFLTLQDLQGKDVKTKHKELFQTKIDLMIVDETHFGARGKEYGKVLQNMQLGKEERKTEKKDYGEDFDLEKLAQSIKTLNAGVRLHLSGTPYRILMGDEFKYEDIIAFCQYTDIAREKEEWDRNHINKDGVNEWDNPYYGFPQMVRFAFHPNESARAKLEELKKSGATYAFSALFRPKSISKDTEHQGHKFFLHEKEILDLLEVIDGSKSDDNVLGFLNYDRIKMGKMCRHMVCVLPFRASCDALEKLIKDNAEKFINLCQYEIINISGVEDESQYKNVKAIKARIKSCEKDGKKTLTLTVNRMLTGSTVEEWDTMIYLKDTYSPQEYDQAIFRLQNQYVARYTDGKGNVIKYNMKPQTLLVDFDPNRMFVMQENKSQIYNVITDKSGNTQLDERIREELRISPIVTINKNKVVQVTPLNIMDAVREYSKDKSVVDEATAIPVDLSLREIKDICAEIERQGKLGSKQGLQLRPSTGEGTNIDIPDVAVGDEATTNKPASTSPSSHDKTAEDDFRKKFATYYTRILFFAFLTKDTVKSLEELLEAVESSDDNKRIARNLELNIPVLKLLYKHINSIICGTLDYKIQNINSLANDTSLTPAERASTAMKKFSRLSSSEIVTPEKLADEMVALFQNSEIDDTTLLLDLASKQGEFVYAVYKKYGKAVADNFYSIPTSKPAYEFTRKVYEALGLDISHIESTHNSYELIEKDTPMVIDNAILINGEKLDFGIVISNPPYQKKDGGAGASATPLYDNFVNFAKRIKPNQISMVMPAKWYTDGKGLDDFRTSMLSDTHIARLVDFTDSRDCFESVDIAGGVCYFLWKQKYAGECEFTNKHQGTDKTTMRNLSENVGFIRHIDAVGIVSKVLALSGHCYNEKVSTRKPFGLATNVEPLDKGDITLKYNNGKGSYSSSLVKVGKQMIPQWKITISRLTAEHAGQTDKAGRKKILSSLDMLAPNEICTETYLVVDAFDTREEAVNLSSYLRTRLVRFLIAQLTATQQMTKEKFAYVPIQDFSDKSDIDWSQSVADIDKQLYRKYGLNEEEQEFIEKMIKPM